MSGKIETKDYVFKVPETKLNKECICLYGTAEKNAETYCEVKKSREQYKRENGNRAQTITLNIFKKSFPLTVLTVGGCALVGAGIGATAFATPAAPVAGPVCTTIGGVGGAAVGVVLARRMIITKVAVAIQQSDHFMLWRTRAIANNVYPVFHNFICTEKEFKPFLCPLSRDIITIPLRAPDGQIYDYAKINDYFTTLTKDPDERIASPFNPEIKFCRNDLYFDRKLCEDLIKKGEKVYARVVKMGNKHIETHGLKAVIDNTRTIMDALYQQAKVETLTELQPRVDRGEITSEQRDRMAEKACIQWNFKKRTPS